MAKTQTNLYLDGVKVNTELAEKYLHEHKNFDDWPESQKIWVYEKYPEKKNVHSATDLSQIKSKDQKSHDINTAYFGRRLAQKIEENETMFGQLEFLIRKTDHIDVKNNIQLISQHLQCGDASWNLGVSSSGYSTVRILFTEETPLYALGCIASALYNSEYMPVNIITTKKTAPLCTFFIKLCAELGWEIPLICINSTEDLSSDLTDFNLIGKCAENGCTGVLYEQADIDSALDFFIESSTTAPWKLRRIYIQESVYEDAKSTLAWKGTRSNVASCVDSFVVKGKVFLFDALSEEIDASGVRVEAYRTTAELRGLLTRRTEPFLSVWAATDVANEIALASPASIVWVNCFTTFQGPPRASLPVYEQMYPRLLQRAISDVCFKSLGAVSTAWVKIDKNKRVDLLAKILHDGATSSVGDSASLKAFGKYQDVVLNSRNGGFAIVDGDRICIGIERPAPRDDVVFVLVHGDDDLCKILHATINGSAVVYKIVALNLDGIIEVLQLLTKSSVPVTEYQEGPSEQSIRQPMTLDKLKVIYTQFGTIFAN